MIGTKIFKVEVILSLFDLEHINIISTAVITENNPISMLDVIVAVNNITVAM